eukprot:SAG22_NODE_335_length_12071_cov_5.268771_3_plen_158_part_00
MESADRLFCTLDPTMRRLQVDGVEVVLVDTIGFISDLPPELVAAFEATLSELRHADLLVHVRDVSSADFERQSASVIDVLRSIGITSTTLESNTLEVWNKTDLISEDALLDKLSECAKQAGCRPASILPVSAATGAGLRSLRTALGRHCARRRELEK